MQLLENAARIVLRRGTFLPHFPANLRPWVNKQAGECAVKVFLLTVVLTLAAAPVSGFFEVKVAVPLPHGVSAEPLPASDRAPVRRAAGRQAVSDIKLRFDGRRLQLSLVRSGKSAMAVLSAAESSPVPVLPEIAEADLRGLMRRATGCRVEGSIQMMAGRQGTLAISAALDCSSA